VLSQERAERSAARRPDGDQRQNALAPLAGLQIRGERPELRYDEDSEHAHPEVEDDARAREIGEQEARLEESEQYQVRDQD
jgi:hypothetical protein